MVSDPKHIKKAAAEVGQNVSGLIDEQLKKVSEDTLVKQLLPKNALGLSDAMVEGIYGQAYRLYNTGKYKDASELFRLLIMLNSTEAKYVMGLAACFHMMKEYQSAVNTYALCGVIDPDSPIPQYQAFECYIQMKDPISAIVSLEMALKRAGAKTEFESLKDRAQLTIESLRKEMEGKEGAKKKVKKKKKKVK